MMIEKRRYKRVACQLPLEYIDLRRSGAMVAGLLINNIDNGGVSFIADNFVPMAGRLLLGIKLPYTTRPIKAISNVTWIKKIPSSNRYVLGVRFLEVSKEDRLAISDFIAVQPR